MGYCSDVKVVLDKKDWKDFKDALINNSNFDGFSKEYFLGRAEELELDNNIVIIKWDYMKWYEHNDEVIGTFMDWLHKRHSENLPFKYIRVGEGAGYDQTDIEVIESFGKNWEFADKYNRIEVNISIDIVE